MTIQRLTLVTCRLVWLDHVSSFRWFTEDTHLMCLMTSEAFTLGSHSGTTCRLGAGWRGGHPRSQHLGFPTAGPCRLPRPGPDGPLPSSGSAASPVPQAAALRRLQALGLLRGTLQHGLFKMGELFEIPGRAEGPAESRSAARAPT